MSLVVDRRTCIQRFDTASSAPLTFHELQTMRSAVAGLIASDPTYLPIFERLDALAAAHEASDPVARARALVAAQKAMA
ncbi:hypothetical protein [Aureimonas pseudogalii]|uniref:Uncharacterized protein n=1 Tax=Aureimonas pseudogalii TaxID=1744844 RepID=A0A7W6H5G0_9HYPH|nr:hypothetical protein [Aureimonas pseudogalii]MBB3998876.1 hypothetical protein [Aureimonas pseudogalii]